MRILALCSCLLLLLGCEPTKQDNENQEAHQMATSDIDKTSSVKHTIKKEPLTSTPNNLVKNKPVTYQEIAWDELIPKTDLDALLAPPEYITDIEDGSIEDQMLNNNQSAMHAEQRAENNYERALVSTNIIEAMDGKHIEVPGFIVPVEFNGAQIVTSFFLVPYFGACLHMPPPPPNQIIYIEIEDGFLLQELYDPVVVSGKLSVALFEDQIATSAYSMTLDKIRMYYENE